MATLSLARNIFDAVFEPQVGEENLNISQKLEQKRRNKILGEFQNEVASSFTTAEERNQLLGGLHIGISDFENEINKRRSSISGLAAQNTFLQKSRENKATAPGRSGTILSSTPTILG